MLTKITEFIFKNLYFPYQKNGEKSDIVLNFFNCLTFCKSF